METTVLQSYLLCRVYGKLYYILCLLVYLRNDSVLSLADKFKSGVKAGRRLSSTSASSLVVRRTRIFNLQRPSFPGRRFPAVEHPVTAERRVEFLRVTPQDSRFHFFSQPT